MWATFVTAELLPIGMGLVLASSLSKKLQLRFLLMAVPMAVLGGLGYALVGTKLGLGNSIALSPALLANDLVENPSLITLILHMALAQAVAIGIVGVLLRVAKPWVQAIAALLGAAIIMPLVSSWLWGNIGASGAGAAWLAGLGTNDHFGHGTVDLGGLASAGLLIGAVGWVALLLSPRRLAPHPMPNAAHPVLAMSGTLMLLLGASAFFLNHPLYSQWPEAAFIYQTKLGAAASVAVLFVLAYAVFVSGRPNWVWLGRAALAAVLACSSAAVLLPTWAAVLAGLVCGLLITVGDYIVNERFQLLDDAATLSSLWLPAALGFVLTGLLADGQFGAGWNSVGADVYLHTPALGIIGFWSSYHDAGQLTAQLIGVFVLSATTLLLATPCLMLMRRGLVLVNVAEESRAVTPATVPTSVPSTAVMEATPALAVTAMPDIAVAAPIELAAPSTTPVETPAPEIAAAEVMPAGLLPQWPTPETERGIPLIAEDEPDMVPVERRGAFANDAPATPQPPLTPNRPPNLLERLRQANQRNRPEQPPRRAARVAYPTRVAGKRLMRPIVEERSQKGDGE